MRNTPFLSIGYNSMNSEVQGLLPMLFLHYISHFIIGMVILIVNLLDVTIKCIIEKSFIYQRRY
jgi:hypothetical protein